MPTLARIHLYPFKSLDPVRVSEARLLPTGALEHDRRFALVDERGTYINGKRITLVHSLRTQFDPAGGEFRVRIADSNQVHTFHVDRQREELAAWFSQYFEMPVSILENTEGGFPDDLELPGPTVISTDTLATVATWFEGVTVDGARDRFRANLEFAAGEPFWEDRLLAPGMGAVRFRIGEAELLGMNPCARCIVPTRDAATGTTIHGFSKEFARRRKESLPAWAPAERFDHFYRLAVNTKPAASRPVVIREGEEVEILGVE
jgi:uncharacterized protein YcbX